MVRMKEQNPLKREYHVNMFTQREICINIFTAHRTGNKHVNQLIRLKFTSAELLSDHIIKSGKEAEKPE